MATPADIAHPKTKKAAVLDRHQRDVQKTVNALRDAGKTVDYIKQSGVLRAGTETGVEFVIMP
jgi:hypothetical protein